MKAFRTLPLAILPTLLLGPACGGGGGLTALQPVFSAEPGEIRFGGVATGTFVEETVIISNIGSASGVIENLALEFGDEQLEVTWTDTDPDDDTLGFDLGPGEAMAAVVRYQPVLEGELSDVLVVTTEVEPLNIPINGLGVFEPIPDICANPEMFDAGIVTYGDTLTEEFEVGNCGFGQLDIGQAVITGAGAAHFAIDSDVVSNQMYPVDSSPGLLTVTFEPTADGVHEAQLEIPSLEPNDDPDENPLIIPLSGRGEGTPLPKGPIAICGADREAGTLETVTLDGSGSWDPNGYTPLTFEWTLTPPPGSAASLSSPNAQNPNFSTDLVGAYVAELYVTNSIGIRSAESCTTTISVAAAENFRIEMFWTYSGDDMDLHLLRTETSAVTSDDDCYYGNCNTSYTSGTPVLDWFGGGIGAEDPALDIDDITGSGPENININDPDPSTYVVVVHDYPGSVYEPAQPVTINIYLDGLLAETYVWDISGEGTYWSIATIDWPSGVVTPCFGTSGC